MSIWATLRIAIKALYANKMRTILTMLGIIIGVASVITMVSIGQGVSKSVESNIASLGTNLLTISPSTLKSGGVYQSGMSVQTLTVSDCDAIGDECPLIAYASPMVRRNMQVVCGNQNWNTVVYGVSYNYGNIRNWEVDQGEFLSDQDVKGSAKVCVIGTTVAENLFAGESPIGQVIRVQKVPFRVVGVLQEKGTGMGGDQDDCIMVPYTTALSRISRMKYIQSIVCSIANEDETEDAISEITALLRQRHRLQDNDEDDFTIRSQADIAETMAQTTGMLTLFLSAIAFISLLVGGIGIMNIMLVSVTERIREIGIRMALGARGSDVLRQFLFESMALSLLGGTIGIISGIILSRIAAHFMNMQTVVSLEAIAISFIFSAGVGVFFGFYPAWQASKLDPIEALRHE
ncbi:MAG: ABC transporter permease [bacterium]|nr:ABC transporter permease [bacterium]